ncbi:MAG TPA: hypothetical protein VEA79_00290 [Phenylobacterium sp.]|nr:hypothetical protein [Phenylobacterium sp.]
MGRFHILLGLLAALAPGLAHAAAGDLFYERTLMRAADARCRLFAPPVAQALAAAQAQARGAALRSGVEGRVLTQVEARARARAAATPCGSRDLATAAARVRSGFAGYARLTRQDYPGDIAPWRADRTPAAEPRWRLAQETRLGFDRLRFGLLGAAVPGELTALVQFADGRTPYAARLVMRDPTRAGGVYLARYDGRRRPPLAGRLPPPSAVRTVMASARRPVTESKATKGFKGGWSFAFPASAVVALDGLDPREAVAVEFLFSRRGAPDEVRRAYIEVGDFAAGRAFLQLPSR